MAGGLTFGVSKDSLRTVVDNGVGVTDARVMRRTNEATQELLAEIIPVNGMAAYNVQSDALGFLLLPKELENVIEALPYEDGVTVYGSADRPNYFYDLVNPFTYLDPSASHNNSLIDHYLVPDPGDPTILRRRYEYPGLKANAFVHIVGAKRYLPVTSDADYLIIQNVPALKLMIQAIERRENIDIDGAGKYKAAALELLQSEVKKHLLDATNYQRRMADWEGDLVTYKFGTMGWIRARLALEVPNAIKMGRDEITRVIQRAEMRLMEMGIWKNCIEEFTAPVVCGHVVMPQRVESILGADLNGEPISVRSIFFKYLKNGPGDWCRWDSMLEDEGEILMNDGFRRRKYRLNTGGVVSSTTTSSSSSSGGSSGGGGDTSGDTITADSFLYIGTNARLVALSNGVKLEIKDGSDTWIEQGEWTE